MKLRIRDRILSALMGLVILLAAAGGLLYLFGLVPDWQGMFIANQFSGWQYWAGVAVCALLMLLGLCGLSILFRRRKDKGFVIQHTEYGDMSISMKAMGNLVRKCVDAHPELTVNTTRISHSRNGVSVELKITLMGGVNIPLTVNALQKQIKQYITSCSGVDVEEVRVIVETDVTSAKLPAPAQEPVAVVELPENRPVEKAAECICQHQEEPSTYAEKPAAEVVAEEEPVVEAEEVLAETVAEEEPAGEEAETEETVEEMSGEAEAEQRDEEAEV